MDKESLVKILRTMVDIAGAGDEVQCAACLYESALEIARIVGLEVSEWDEISRLGETR